MSLIHWWPLIGTATDKVGGGPSVSSPTYVSGKLGQALDSGAITGTAEQWNQWMSGGSVSIALWAKVDATGSFSHGTPFFGNGNSGKRKFTLFSYSSSTDDLTRRTSLHYAWQHDGLSGYNTYVTGVIDGFFEKDTWVHLCATQDAQAGIVRFYKNGALVKEHTGLTLSNVTFTTTDSSYFRSNYNYMKVNDLRLYDHALSQAEVKELSKALVMHYTFDDILAEPTTNIITGIKSASGKASLDSGRVKINWSPSGGDSYFMFNYSQAITANSVYTLSFDCEGLKTGEVATFAVSNLSAASYNIALQNGRNSLTFTAGSDLMNDINTYNRLFFDDKTRTDGAVFYLSNFQLEERDHATPYTPTNRESMIYNETGLAPTTNFSNIALSTNSATGSYSLKCNNSWIYNETSSNGQQFLTMAAWVNPTDYSGDGIIIGGAYLCLNSSGKLYVYCYGRTPEQYFTGTTTVPTGQWTHIAVTWDDKDCTGYVNGVQEFKKSHPGIPNSTHHNKKDIGSEYGTRRFFNGLIDDARVYNTCLSGDDIADLCKTKAYIDDQGGINCGQFVEASDAAQVTEKHCFQASEIHEKSLNGYELLDYIEGNGTQYINLGIHVGNEMVVDTAVTNPSGYIVTQYNYGLRTSGSTIVHFTQNQNLKVAGVIQSGVKVKVYLTNTSLVANGIVGTSFVDNDNPSGNVTIFGQGSSPAGSGRIHYCRLWKGDTLVRYLLPVKRLSDNAIGMYDAANNVLYTSATATAFTAGPVITSTAMIYDTQEIAGRILNEI